MLVALLAPVFSINPLAQGARTSCNGPTGSAAAPYGECNDSVDDDGFKEVQLELWESIFGTDSSAAQLTYELEEGTEFNGSGDYKGATIGNVHTFSLHVHMATDAFDDFARDGMLVSGWHVLASVTGPTNSATPVVGLVLRVQQPSTLAVPQYTMMMAGHMSSQMATRVKQHEALIVHPVGVPGENSPYTPGQLSCAAGCMRVYKAAVNSANAMLALELAGATAALAAAVMSCSGGVAIPLIGAIGAGACAAIYLALYVAALAAIEWVRDAALQEAHANLGICMMACGVLIYE
jgi:hypothetical protein